MTSDLALTGFALSGLAALKSVEGIVSNLIPAAMAGPASAADAPKTLTERAGGPADIKRWKPKLSRPAPMPAVAMQKRFGQRIPASIRMKPDTTSHSKTGMLNRFAAASIRISFSIRSMVCPEWLKKGNRAPEVDFCPDFPINCNQMPPIGGHCWLVGNRIA